MHVFRVAAEGMSDVEFLQGLQSTWQEYTTSIKIVSNVFLFLDRVFVLNRPELASIWRLSMLQFRTHAMGDAAAEGRVVAALLGLIKADRQTEMSEEGVLISRTIEMLKELQVIELWTHEAIKKATVEYFDEEAQQRLAALSVADYLDYVKGRIDDEARRYSVYGLDGQFSGELLNLVRKSLFVDRLHTHLRAGLASLMAVEDFAHIEHLYALARETGSEEVLRAFWLDHIKSSGAALVQDESKEEQVIVQEIIAMKDRLDRAVSKSLGDSKVFADGLKESFESFMNSRQNRPVELIARFADYQLRGAGQSVATPLSPEEEGRLMSVLDKVIMLFRFVQGKDSFEAIFKKDLARRLLYSRSVSVEAERSFVAKLKAECGSAFTSRLEGMFKDMDTTKSTMAAYQKTAAQQARKRPLPPQASRMDFTTTVISYGIWPSAPPLAVQLPPLIEEEQQAFADFYDSQHASRILKFNQGLGHCVLKANFPQGLKEIQVSVPQAVVLLLFNDTADQLSYGEIQARTGLDDANLTRTLHSLSWGKINILEKTPGTREILPTDMFAFNAGFTSKHHKIRINNIASREAAEEIPVSPSEEVAADRQYLIDAAIIRVLKRQKSLELYKLVELVSEQIKAPLGAAECSKRLEMLMEREFVTRSPENPNIYTYLA